MSNKKHGIRYNNTTFVEKAITILGSKYDFSKVNYINSTTKVALICPQHGEFTKRPCDILHQSQGCPKCSHNYSYTHADFCDKSHDRYGDKFEIVSTYNGMKHPITLSCKYHGRFTLPKAENHFISSGGCPDCLLDTRMTNLKPGNISKVEKEWLDSLSVPLRQHTIIINSKKFIVDGFDPKTNTVYEYHGSFWHGNPSIFNKDDINPVLNVTFGELYERTKHREHIIESQFNLITKWSET